MELRNSLFIILLSIGSIFYFFVKLSHDYWKRRGILHQKPKFFWGNIKGVGRKRHICEVLQSTYDEYKSRAPFIGFYAYIKPFVLVLDLNLVQQILSSDAKNFMSRGLYSNVSDEPLSCNLLQLDSMQWEQLQSKVWQVFTIEKIQALVPHLLNVAAIFKRFLATKQQQQQIFIINDLVDCYNVGVISTLVFGLSDDTLRFSHSEFRDMTCAYLQNFNLLKAYLAMEFPLIARLLQYKSYNQQASDYFLKLVSERLKEHEWGRRDKLQNLDDFLQILMADKNRRCVKLRLTDNEIAAQAFTFVLGGLVPLNSTLTFCLYELGLRPELQERARAEIRRVLQQHDGQLTTETLKKLKYLKQIIKETLRLHSPYPFLLRKTTKEFELPNSVFVLAQGNNVIIPIHAMHRDPSIYQEPDRFDPDRFEDNAIKGRHPMSWLPFGYGPRGCISVYFAEMQLLVGLVCLLQQYKYTPCSDTPIPLQYDNSKLLLSPKSEIKFNIEPIEDS